MIQKISIKNFKSVHNNEMELGRFNVLIGENGSGKSNILEAIAFGGAASANMLNNEFLASRGIRMTRPELMRSCFTEKGSYTIELTFNVMVDEKKKIAINIWGDNFEKWHKKIIVNNENKIDVTKILPIVFQGKKNTVIEGISDEEKRYMDELKKFLPKRMSKAEKEEWLNVIVNGKFNLTYSNKDSSYPSMSNFLIFSPSNSALRNFFDERQVFPLGIQGEGLFNLLQEVSQENKGSQLKKIINALKIIDWFEGFELGSNRFPGSKIIKIKDKYISDSIQYIDQRSTNEGFLFLLFYITLFVSDKTPEFFAIDNIEASFNPKLCIKLIQVLAKLAKEHKKQVIVTTHNPFILDGLNLADYDQRLFVVRRNLDGHTITNRVQPKEKLTVPLSEAWMRGYIGGLPNNF